MTGQTPDSTAIAYDYPGYYLYPSHPERQPSLGAPAKPARLIVHHPAMCKDRPACVIHDPSEHHMRTMPLLLRADKQGLAERVCPCGTSHPDPDDAEFWRDSDMAFMTIHHCCGKQCCVPPDRRPVALDTKTSQES